MTVAVVQSARSCQPPRAIAGNRTRRWHPVELLPLAYYVVVAGVLAHAGYPLWRVLCFALPAAAQQRAVYRLRSCGPRVAASGDAARAARGAVIIQLSCLATSLVAVAVTGGVKSPLLVTSISAYLSAVLIAGDRRETRLLVGVTALGIAILAALPRSWAGPELTAPTYALLVVISMLGVGALLAPFHHAMRDVREALKRARDDMASDALCRARTLEQIGAKVAHELKNPLSAIKALVQLSARAASDLHSQERLEVVEKEISRMQDILADYLSFTRPLQEVSPRRVELGTVVADAVAVLSARADDGRVTISTRGDATVEADPRRLKEAILNLATNAIEATPPGGDVLVEVLPSPDAAEIVVRDTGRGMPAEVLKRLGTPFFTTRDEGTGLGVVMARSVVAQHGGSLHYDSEPGAGTIATIRLPRRASPRYRDGARAVS